MSESDKTQGGKNPDEPVNDAIPEGVAPSGKSTLRIVRDGFFGQAKKTLEFIDQSEKDKTVKVRVDDQRSALFLIIGLTLATIFVSTLLINPNLPDVPVWRPVFFAVGLIADAFLGASVLWYVALRFGILRKMDARYAVLCFQLLLGTGIMFAYFSFNAVVFFLAFVYKWGPIIPGPTSAPGM